VDVSSAKCGLTYISNVSTNQNKLIEIFLENVSNMLRIKSEILSYKMCIQFL
jgi:hypothetical protein